VAVRRFFSVFTRGEISRKLFGRLDLEAYHRGCQEIENFLVTRQGSLERRPGTYHVASAASHTSSTILIPFVVTATCSYALEFGDQTLRVFNSSHAQVQSSGSAYEVSTPFYSSQLSLLQYQQVTTVMYIATGVHPVQRLTYTSAASWTISACTFTASTGDVTFASASVYPAAIGFAEDRLYLANTPAYPNRIWGSKSGEHTNFTLNTTDADAFDFTLGGPKVSEIRWIENSSDGMVIGADSREGILMGGDNGITPGAAYMRWRSSFGSRAMRPIIFNDSLIFMQRSGKTLREYYYQEGWKSPNLNAFAEHIAGEDGDFVDIDYQQDPDPIVWATRSDGEIATMAFDRASDLLAWSRQVTDGSVKSICIIPNGHEDEVWAIVEREIDGNTRQYVEYFAPRECNDVEDAHFVDSGIVSELDTGVITGITKASQATLTFSSSLSVTTAYSVRTDGAGGMTEINGLVSTVVSVSGATAVINRDTSAFTAYTSGGTVKVVTKAVTGLDHLEGKTVSILADGAPHADCVVSSGAVTLNLWSNKVHAGLPFTSTVMSVPLESGDGGTEQGLRGKIYRILVRFYKTVGCQVGRDAATLEHILFRDANDYLGQATALYSGDQVVNFPGTYDRDRQVMIVQDQPLPCNILGFIPEIDTHRE